MMQWGKMMNERRKRFSPKAVTGRASSRGFDKRPTILIVCEDFKASISYFNWLAEKLGIKNNVHTDHPNKYHQPDKLVEYAYKQRETTTFTKIFCVFDKDDYAERFTKAVEMFLKEGADKTVIDAHSVPCFEFWLLMHYYFTTALMSPREAESLFKSKASISDYRKGAKNLGLKSSELNDLFDKLNNALENSDKAIKLIKKGEDSSYTKIGAVVKEMMSIRDTMQAR